MTIAAYLLAFCCAAVAIVQIHLERLAALRARRRRRAIGPLALLLDRPQASGDLDDAQRVACVEAGAQ